MKKITKKQLNLFVFIKSLGRLPDEDEITDYYVENHMTENPDCKFDSWNYYLAKKNDPKTKRKNYVSEWTYTELRLRAMVWYQGALGRIVIQGLLSIDQSSLDKNVNCLINSKI